MYLRNNWYIADKGKHFVLTEKGQAECRSYQEKVIGESVCEYDTEAVHKDVELGYVKEVPIPDWTTKPGYGVMYTHKGHQIYVGNPIVFPERELAENYMDNYSKKPWMECELLIVDMIYEGRSPKPRRFYNNKPVFNQSWYFGIDALKRGCYVEEEIVEELRNCCPPAYDGCSCMQLGEIDSHVEDEHSHLRATYATFKKIADNTWEYCGACFRGNSIPPVCTSLSAC